MKKKFVFIICHKREHKNEYNKKDEWMNNINREARKTNEQMFHN